MIVEVVGIALIHIEAAAIQMSFHGHNPRCPGTDTHFSKNFPDGGDSPREIAQLLFLPQPPSAFSPEMRLKDPGCFDVAYQFERYVLPFNSSALLDIFPFLFCVLGVYPNESSPSHLCQKREGRGCHGNDKHKQNTRTQYPHTQQGKWVSFSGCLDLTR